MMEKNIAREGKKAKGLPLFRRTCGLFLRHISYRSQITTFRFHVSLLFFVFFLRCCAGVDGIRPLKPNPLSELWMFTFTAPCDLSSHNKSQERHCISSCLVRYLAVDRIETALYWWYHTITSTLCSFVRTLSSATRPNDRGNG